MEKLPTEIITKIFEYLSHSDVLRCAMVYTTWYKVARQQRFFGKLVIDESMTKKLPEIEKVFTETHVLPISKLVILDTNQEEQVSKLIKRLEHIRDLTIFLHPQILDSQIKWINTFSHIEHLGIHSGFEMIADLSNIEPNASIRTLESNDIGVIEDLMPKLPKLRKVYFKPDVKSRPNWEKLHKIAASGVIVEFKPMYISLISVFRDLIQGAKPNIEIKEAEINLSQGIGMKSITQFAHTYGTLRNLCLYVTDELTPTTLVDIADCIPNLQHLKIDGIMKWPIQFMLNDLAPCKNLQSLELVFSRYSDEQHRLRFVKKITSFPNLRRFKVVDGERVQMADRQFDWMVKSCPWLTDLELHCALTKTQTQSLLKNLKCLKKVMLHNVSDNELEAVSNLYGLEELWICNADEVTDAGFTKLKTLKVLEIRSCRNLTDDGVEMITKECPLIERLYIQGARKLTEMSTQAIERNLKYLKSLGLYRCVPE